VEVRSGRPGILAHSQTTLHPGFWDSTPCCHGDTNNTCWTAELCQRKWFTSLSKTEQQLVPNLPGLYLLEVVVIFQPSLHQIKIGIIFEMLINSWSHSPNNTNSSLCIAAVTPTTNLLKFPARNASLVRFNGSEFCPPWPTVDQSKTPLPG